jgi:hypothetical protein
MTLLEIAELSDAQLNVLAKRERSRSLVARFAREEQLIRQLSGVSRSILTDIFTNPDAYDLSFDDVHMLSRYLVNVDARQLYRDSDGEISPDLAAELRLSFYDEQAVARFADAIYENIEAGVERPLSPKEFMRMGVVLGCNIFMLSDFDGINRELEAVGSPLRYAGTEPQESSPFLFVLFLTPQRASIIPEMYDPNILLKFESEVFAPLVSDDKNAQDSYLRDKEDQFSNNQFFEIYCEMVRSPALPPDVNGVNFRTAQRRYINVWCESLPREFFL